jgi:hypothetical protein
LISASVGATLANSVLSTFGALGAAAGAGAGLGAGFESLLDGALGAGTCGAGACAAGACDAGACDAGGWSAITAEHMPVDISKKQAAIFIVAAPYKCLLVCHRPYNASNSHGYCELATSMRARWVTFGSLLE